MDVIRIFDPWKNPYCPCPKKYTLNPITGCGHKCLYCYITSYIPDAFNPRPKKNIVERVRKDLMKIPSGSVIAISYSSDPYSPPEGKLKNMRGILKLMKEYNMNILIATKSSLVLRDIDFLSDIDCVVSISITTYSDNLSKILEPGAPPTSNRLKTIKELVNHDIPVSLRVDPIIPFLTDDLTSLENLIGENIRLGVKHVVSSIYKAKPDSIRRLSEVFPELAGKWSKLYYVSGTRMFGYRYAPEVYRRNILQKIRMIVKDSGMKYSKYVSFNVCREGFFDLDDRGSYCDASHLLKTKHRKSRLI